MCPSENPGAHPTDATASPALSEHEVLQQNIASIFIGALTGNLIRLGDSLGLYRGLKQHGPCTAGELASQLGLVERYVAEWLRQQASAKLISCDEAAERFWLTPAQQDVLVHEHGDEASPWFFAGGFTALPGLSKISGPGGRLEQCFRQGGGIAYDEYDEGVTCGTCRELAVWVRHRLVESLKSVPGLGEKLEAGCKVADVGCGCGEALMTVAAAFPSCTCVGYDLSEKALSTAREEAKRRGLTNVTFQNSGLEDEALPAEPTYHLIMTHDAVHDMAKPSMVLPHVRNAVGDDGCYIVGDMSALENHAQNVHSHPMAAFLYGFSCHLCLPSGMSAPGGEGLGTLGISETKMKEMLLAAGFGSAEVLEWENPINRYYIAKV